jgi:two-component system, NarL family, invasion response regulator UvrY
MTEAHGEGLVPMLVVDDQEPFREIMRELVAATPGFELVGEAASGESALVAIAELSPELVIMDVRMPGMGGIEATRRLADEHSDVSVILISVEPLDNLPESARECGAAAFARKQDLSPRLIRELWSQRVGV